MHLKSLTLKGFKSFASSTTLVLEPGICAVVGPNGSGKSNVVDALAWVMGEQGAKTLRGAAMNDVIFAGAGDRKALGRAEVTLTIDNQDGALPIDYNEVSITRRVYRDGGSEYEINGSNARLMDIQELLSDSGIGREMHVIVGQVRLSSILESKPEDRRAYIEEAAGVLKHRRRKDKAERKLVSMQGNIDRLTDLTTELSKQLKPLARQAEAASRAATVQAELREATAVLSHEFRTPVTAIRGILEALEYDMPAELQQSFVAQGLQETERLARLVEDLAVGFRPTRARTLTLSEAFERVERLLAAEYDLGRPGAAPRRGAAAPRKAGQVQFGEDHLVRADPDKLLQVLLNLIENALKYGPVGEEIRVRTTVRGTWVEVAVLDSGPAIPDTETLFQAHTRGRTATGQGSGMGLYIVRSIVQGWGGQAWAERQGDQNAFCFTLPGVAGLGAAG